MRPGEGNGGMGLCLARIRRRAKQRNWNFRLFEIMSTCLFRGAAVPNFRSSAGELGVDERASQTSTYLSRYSESVERQYEIRRYMQQGIG